MAERVLTPRELNRAVLARQLLLVDRATLPIPRALERLAGIQNQYAPNGYIRLWSCLEHLQRDDLTNALERRTVIQATLMRSTVHLVSRKDYWLFVHAVRRPLKQWWLRTIKPARTDKEMQDVAKRLRDLLADGLRSQAELAKVVERGWGMAGPWLDLVRVPPSGTWDRRRANLYGLAEQWVGPEPHEDEVAAHRHLVRRYLGGFGPASRNDIATFTGIAITQLTATLERLDLRKFRDEAGKELLDVPRAPLPHPDTPTSVRYLPTWDAVLLVHARRGGILPEEYRKLIFRNDAPASFPTFLVDGQVAGTWNYANGRIELDPFERLAKETRRALDDEGDRLAELHR